MRAVFSHMPRVSVKIKAGGGHARVARGACRVGGMKQKRNMILKANIIRLSASAPPADDNK